MRQPLQLIVSVFAVILWGVTEAGAATFLVTKTADTADGTCDADCSLREAIIAANAAAGDDIITLPAGTYTLSLAGTGEDAAATGDLDITSNLTINGAGGLTTAVNANNIDRGFHIVGTQTVVINNLRIKEGQAPNGAASNGSPGGGILIDNGTVTLSGLTVTSNNAGSGGNGDGAAGFNGACGGGIAILNGTVSINEGTISSNDAGNGGTGAAGFAGGSGGSGGGICLSGGTLTLMNSEIQNNDAGAGGSGGGMGDPSGAGGDGGGVALLGGTGTLTNNTLAFNAAGGGETGGGGGAIATSGGAVTIKNNTITINGPGGGTTTPGEGGGVFRSAGTLTIGNSIVAENVPAPGGTSPDCSGTVTSSGFNLIGIGTGCTGPTNGVNGDEVGTGTSPIEPLFDLAGLTDNGGPTQTVAIQSGSPALNTGDNATCASQDQRGETRLLSSSDACDKGAFELAICGNGSVQSGETCDDGNVNAGDGCDASCQSEGEDHDGDGILDDSDNCPLNSNLDQEDDDEDGVGNECETSDLDDDGITDTSDNCPIHFNPDQDDDDGDGFGDECDPDFSDVATCSLRPLDPSAPSAVFSNLWVSLWPLFGVGLVLFGIRRIRRARNKG